MNNDIKIHPLINEIKTEIINNRRYFHKYPELSFEEFNTSKVIEQKLIDMGITDITKMAKTGLIANIHGNKRGKNIGLRADMDALPIQETSDLPFKSINDGVMHACGHDGHIAMLLGAAKAINDRKEQLNGSVRLIFQPAEEGSAGATYMIKDGALDSIDEIYGIHLWNYQKVGQIGVKSGPVMAAADMFNIKIIGKGGHGATPHGTIDAIMVAAQLVNSLQTIVSRNTNPIDSTVVTIGMINGGYNFNVIADNVSLEGTCRAYTKENRSLIKKRMNEIISGLENMYGAEIILNYKDGYPPTINDNKCARNVLTAAHKIVKEGAGPPYLSMG